MKSLLRKRNQYLKYSKRFGFTNCAICLGDIQTGSQTSCGHTYHTDCIQKWLVQNDNCPLCRQTCTLIQTDKDVKINTIYDVIKLNNRRESIQKRYIPDYIDKIKKYKETLKNKGYIETPNSIIEQLLKYLQNKK